MLIDDLIFSVENTLPPPCIKCTFYLICASKKLACREFSAYVNSPYKKKSYPIFLNLSIDDMVIIKNIEQTDWQKTEGYSASFYKKIKKMKIKNEDYKDKKFSEKEMKFIKELLKIGKYYNLSRKIIKNTPHNRLPNRKIYNNLFTDYDN